MDPTEPDDADLLDRLGPGLLRAAWLISGDAHIATDACAQAVADVMGRRRAPAQGRTVAAYTALLAALPRVDPPLPQGTSQDTEVQRRRLECVAAYRRLPRAEREAVVLADHTELGDLDVAHVLRRSPRRVDQEVARARTELPPLAEVPVPALLPDHDVVADLVARGNRSRRAALLGAGAAVVAAGAAVGGWWINRPFAGEVSYDGIDRAALPTAVPRHTASGRLFDWVRRRTDAAEFGVVELTNRGGDGPVVRLRLRNGTPVATVDNLDLSLERTGWGWLLQLTTERYAVVDIPLDTDGLWILDPPQHSAPPVQENRAWGVELPRQAALGVAYDERFESGAPVEVFWRTASGRVETGSGKPAYAVSAEDVTAILLNGARTVALVDDINSVLFSAPVGDELQHSEYTGGGHRVHLHVLPEGATGVTATAIDPAVSVEATTFEAVGRTVVLAYGPDFSPTDQPLITLSWTADGRRTSRREP